MKVLAAALCATSVLMSVGTLAADEWKDESGKGYELRDHQDGSDRKREDRHAQSVHNEAPDIPYGHFPPPAECRDWYLGHPAGHQPSPYKC